MDVMKTKNLRLVLYSIFRQVRNGDKVRYDILDNKNYHFIELNRLSSGRNTIYAMQGIAEIKKHIDSGEHVKIEIYNQFNFTINNEEGEFYIDNADTLLKYILFDMLHDVDCLRVKLKSKDGLELRNNKFMLGVLTNFKSVLLLENKIEKEYYELVEEVYNEICMYIKDTEKEYPQALLELSNGKDRIQFYIVV